jgi:glutathione S-transferase
MADNTLILYGVPFSQPVRAVMWLLLMKRHPFRMVLINPGTTGETGSRNPTYLLKNPGGTIPCIEEPDSGFTLGEAHAILTYLSRKHGWTDVYPADEQVRARIDWYLHYHHRNVREASVGMVAPRIRKDLQIAESSQQASRRILTSALRTLDTGWLAGHRYLVGDSVSLADLAAYVEIGQLQPQFTNTFDLTPYANVQRWLKDMSQVDSHDDVHVVLRELGDISAEAPSMDKIKSANKLALSTLKQRMTSLG